MFKPLSETPIHSFLVISSGESRSILILARRKSLSTPKIALTLPRQPTTQEASRRSDKRQPFVERSLEPIDKNLHTHTLPLRVIRISWLLYSEAFSEFTAQRVAEITKSFIKLRLQL